MGRDHLSVSVVIPVFNRMEALRATLISIARQTIKPDQVVIVDDVSTPKIAVTDFREFYGVLNIDVCTNSHNMGGASSRNNGALHSASDIIVFLDSDDQLMPQYIEVISDVWSREFENISLLATGFYWCTDAMKPYKRQGANDMVTRDALLRLGNFVGGCSVLSVKRDDFLAAGMFATKRGVDDWRFLLRIAKVGAIKMIARPLVMYRSPSASELETMTRVPRRQIIALISLLKELPAEERQIARPQVRALVANHLAMGGRRRLAMRQVIGMLRERRHLNMFTLRIIIICSTGPRLAKATFRALAQWRTRFFNTADENYA